jgi:hypothetical protein
MGTHAMEPGRVIQPELLDRLPPEAASAIRSRRDLCLLNSIMRNAGILANSCRRHCQVRPVKRVVELGAGDGMFALELARRLPDLWANAELVLIDQHRIVTPRTIRRIEEGSSRVIAIQSDVFDWLESSDQGEADVIYANLFLHHFSAPQLRRMARSIARRTAFFTACEPRRSTFAQISSRLIWVLGCNRVTMHDARVSVRAGFTGRELSQSWNPDSGWTTHEGPAGLFSHLFAAVKRREPACGCSSPRAE